MDSEVIVVATNNVGKAREIAEMFEAEGNGGQAASGCFADIGRGVEVISLSEVLGYKAQIEEDGETFKENALIKAREARRLIAERYSAEVNGRESLIPQHTGSRQSRRTNDSAIICLADDSGLCVDCLSGAPGVYSARYAGTNATDADNVEKLLREIASTATVAHGFDVVDIGGGNGGGKVNREAPTARFVCSVVAILDNGSEVWVEETCEGKITSKIAGSNGFGYDPVFYLPDFGCTMAELDGAVKNKISHRGKAIRRLKEKLSVILNQTS